ncbi:MAG: LysM peptidoglycan-binding domain-containing protein, partial [Acidimicrobiales bacterium]
RPPEPQPAQEPAPGAAQMYTVAVGDSFWSIAEDQVTIRLGRTPTDAEVLEPWLALIDANRDRLLDPADPDLLHPGQVLRLPDT